MHKPNKNSIFDVKIKSMKKLLLIVFLIPILNTGCKDDETPTTGGNTDTLNKELLYDKLWLNEPATISHMIKADGTYSVSGTWEWVNGTDTMKTINNTKTFYWVFNKGNTADKMETKLRGENNWEEFRTSW